MNLLTIDNPKTLKGEKKGYLTAILHLAPAWLSGRNTCPMATAGCAAACLNTAGRGGIGLDAQGLNTIQRARIARTNWYFDDRLAFMAKLEKEVRLHIARAERAGLIPVFRLNGTSDLRWERTPVVSRGILYPNIMAAFPRVQFYDYTKLTNRRDLPANYHLTYSLADGNDDSAATALAAGLNVAVVLRGYGDSAHPKPMPATFRGAPLVDGDESDLRFLDGHGQYVGLRAKGRAKTDTTGFVKTWEA